MLKSITLIAISCLLSGNFVFGQDKYFTRDGEVSFFSSTPVEDIEAHNHKLTSVLDVNTGKFEFAALMKSFEFEKSLMEEHFNENYVESNKFPKATFKGDIMDFEGLKGGGFPEGTDVIAKGTMSIHGVEREVDLPAKLAKEGDGYTLHCKFIVTPEHYDIEIPNTVRGNIASEIEVTVDAALKALTR